MKKIIITEEQLSKLIEEGKYDYEIYHKTYTSAIKTALKYANIRGYEYDEDEVATRVGFGPRKPDAGNTNKFTITLYKDGKELRKTLQIQVYGMESGNYELNTYIA